MAEATKTSWTSWLFAALFGAAVLSGAVFAVQGLYARADSSEALAPRPPLTVAITPLAIVESYTIRESFVGQVEPARETMPAAERMGLVIEMLVEEGEQIRQDQIIARLDPVPLEIERTRLMAERDSLDAEIDLAKRTTDRQERLSGQGWSSRQRYDEARFGATALTARRAAVTAAIARIDLDLEKSVIQAPFDGVVADRMIDEGTVVSAGTGLVRLQEIDRPQARIGVPLERVAGLELGQELSLRNEGKPIKGRIAAITRDMQPGTRTVPVLVDLIAEEPLIMGQVVRLSLPREIPSQGAWVALSALQEAERGLWSLQTVVAGPDGQTVRREAVEILHIEGERAFVRGTFADGASVVTVGAHKLSNGQAVAAVEG